MAATVRLPTLRCRATNRHGKRCGNQAIPGGSVCRLHGGSAPQVRQAAQERLAQLVHPAIDRLSHLIQDDDVAEAVALAACRDILDRNGLQAIKKVEVSAGPGHDDIDDAIDRLLNERAALVAGGEDSAAVEAASPPEPDPAP